MTPDAQSAPAPRGTLLLEFDRFREEGLYLVFDDGHELRITRPHIEQASRAFAKNPDLIPQSCREATAFAPCSICPKRKTATFCHAIPTVFPFLDDLDRHLSYEAVTVVFRSSDDGSEDGVFHVARASMQRALQHVAILSVMYYCEIGLHYHRYFSGVLPFMDPQRIAERLYANIVLHLCGDTAAIEAKIDSLRGDVAFTMECQVKRLRVVCRNDAFINAFTGLHTALTYLAPDLRPLLHERLAKRQRAPYAAE